MQWRHFFIVVGVHAAMMLVLLGAFLAGNDDGSGIASMPFALPMLMGAGSLSSLHKDRTSTATRLFAMTSIFAMSFISYPAHWLLPIRMPSPAQGPLLALAGGIAAIPILYIVGFFARPRRNTRTTQRDTPKE